MNGLGENSNSEVSQIVDFAYEILSNKELRKIYDEGLKWAQSGENIGEAGIYRLYLTKSIPDNFILYKKEWNIKQKQINNNIKKLNMLTQKRI